MNRQTKLGGTFTLPGASLNLYRMGYGAMQLAGPGVWGLPPNIDEANLPSASRKLTAAQRS